jgi:hypothetical protein
VRKPITFASAIVLLFAVWLAAEKKDNMVRVQLQTTFDFNEYPACGRSSTSNCVVAIQFYDAASHQILATKVTEPGITGRQTIVATTNASSFPRRVYAATVYLDDSGRRQSGPRGQISEYVYRGER